MENKLWVLKLKYFEVIKNIRFIDIGFFRFLILIDRPRNKNFSS